MVFGVLFMVWKVLDVVGGLQAGVDGLARRSAPTPRPPVSLTSIGGPSPYNLVILVLMTSVGTFGLPQMISKFQRHPRRAKRPAVPQIMSTVSSP